MQINWQRFVYTLVLSAALIIFGGRFSQAATQIDIQGPTGSGSFGQSVNVLPNGNIVVTDTSFKITSPTVIANVGAVHLYNGASGELISTLTGSSANDRIGERGITVLSNGNFVISSPNWDLNATAVNAGAVTFCSAATGCSGVVSSTNSLIGSRSGDSVGNGEVTGLPTGNYVIRSPSWDNGAFANAGSVTFCNGTNGCTGTISSANSLVGSNAEDFVGGRALKILPNGNYIVVSSVWSGSRGAVTVGSGTAGTTGEVSPGNSLVGSNTTDRIGETVNSLNGVTILTNGNFVVSSIYWNGLRGAVSFCSGTSNCRGEVSASNSLLGTNPNDTVGIGGVTALTNGNYVVLSYAWNGNRGAVTFGDGNTGVSGAVSISNSLIGSTGTERVGEFVVPLNNGNYVVRSASGYAGRGAATFGDGTTGVSGVISPENSLVGVSVGDFQQNQIILLTNGNYIVSTPWWSLDSQQNRTLGAVTFGNGATGVRGVISSENSLVGSQANDFVGRNIVVLPNGNYVVVSDYWNLRRGAVTFGSGSVGVVGVASVANSLVGSNSGDAIGEYGVTALNNGNYVIRSPSWSSGRGATTFCNGTAVSSGTISAANSLIGSNNLDRIGNGDVEALPNGNYIVSSPDWNDGRGAATFANGISGIIGVVSSSNSLVGTSTNDRVGFPYALPNGNYIVASQYGSRGAVTWGNGTAGIVGEVSSANSIIGTSSSEGFSPINVKILNNSSYLIIYPAWNGNRGAVVYGDGATGVSGTISTSNSLLGSTANDLVGSGGATELANGTYIVNSPNWDNGSITDAGAISISEVNAPILGNITGENSVRGTAPSGGVRHVCAYDLVKKQLIVGRPSSNITSLFRSDKISAAFDFDGDGRADVSVFRPSNGIWYLNRSSQGFFGVQFGAANDKLTPADFDGDAKTDVSVFRDGAWYRLNSSDNQFVAVQFGQMGDAPVPSDYDGDGKADVAVFRAGTWYVLQSSNNQLRAEQFGASGDKAVPADYDADGRTDLAVFRAGTWYMLRSTAGFAAVQFGQMEDKPVAADYDGDGRADQAVFRNGTWYLLRSQQGFTGIAFGVSTDIPTPADYDGDSKADITVFRAGTWYLQQSTNGFAAIAFGTAGDVPTPSAYIE